MRASATFALKLDACFRLVPFAIFCSLIQPFNSPYQKPSLLVLREFPAGLLIPHLPQ
jgi:hypothetical protein